MQDSTIITRDKILDQDDYSNLFIQSYMPKKERKKMEECVHFQIADNRYVLP